MRPGQLGSSENLNALKSLGFSPVYFLIYVVTKAYQKDYLIPKRGLK